MEGQAAGTPQHAPEVAAQYARLHDVADGEPVWVFGYGSLLWNPGFEFVERRPAVLYGYHRAFCIISEHYRGTPDQHGLVLGLDRGGSCQGMVFRLPEDGLHDILDYLWEREMLTWGRGMDSTVYNMRVLTARTDAGRVTCRTFVANRAHHEYAGRLPEAQVVDMIRRGVGVSGTNRDYLANTVGHLDELGIGDGPLHRLLRRVERGGS